MFLRSSKNRMKYKNFNNIFSLRCPKNDIQNTKTQLKKIGPSQIDKIIAQENFMGNNLEKTKIELLSFDHFCKYLGDIFYASLKYVYNSQYLLPASFGCLLWAADRQPATLRLVKPSKSSKMDNSKDKVDFLVQITFIFNFLCPR